MAGKGHVGKAGHLAVMAELLLRGYNVAMPEVDEGDDIFVVHNQRGQLWRVQVKTAVGKPGGRGHRGKFAVALNQLSTAREPDLFYVLAIRRGTVWDQVVLARPVLLEEHRAYGAGWVSGGNVLFTVRFSDSAVLCSGRDWQAHRNNWAEWPMLG
jgi:hypothetical protein